ncbi:hypothetical protein [Maridesulfovibrio bastinii]|uniref:hypothetical protein n=1 Tax=Maridesulfovibrio bastinii TaxID=47157 RepID=UPI001B7F8DCD|nr:hypothetical protein [Maridesulfovibrio bastinii]
MVVQKNDIYYPHTSPDTHAFYLNAVCSIYKNSDQSVLPDILNLSALLLALNNQNKTEPVKKSKEYCPLVLSEKYRENPKYFLLRDSSHEFEENFCVGGYVCCPFVPVVFRGITHYYSWS